jgi:hypothetical protein
MTVKRAKDRLLNFTPSLLRWIADANSMNLTDFLV